MNPRVACFKFTCSASRNKAYFGRTLTNQGDSADYRESGLPVRDREGHAPAGSQFGLGLIRQRVWTDLELHDVAGHASATFGMPDGYAVGAGP